MIWLPDATPRDLNDLGISPVVAGGTWTLNTAKALTADGWVAGEGTFDPDADGPLKGYQRLWVAQVGLGGRWANTTGGVWGRGPNWSTGTPAMQVGNAVFDLDETYIVTLDRDELTGSVSVTAGMVTFDLAGHTLATEDGVSITQDATLHMVGTIASDIANDGTLEFDIGGLVDYDSLDVTGTFNAGGTIAVKLLDGYSPMESDEFALMSFATFVDEGYEFDFSNAELATGLTWETSSFATTGTISVVPEPGMMAMLLTPLLGLLSRFGQHCAC